MIIMYTKTGCPWCDGARDFLNEKGVPFEERNVLQNAEYFDELKTKSNQEKTPTLDMDGEILADVGREEIEVFLKEKGLIS